MKNPKARPVIPLRRRALAQVDVPIDVSRDAPVAPVVEPPPEAAAPAELDPLDGWAPEPLGWWADHDPSNPGPDPPRPDAAAPAGLDVRTPAAVAAAVVLGVSAGDGFVAAVALLIAAGPVTGATAGLAMAATVARWGTADLGAVAGDQAVLGAAIATGPAAAVASSALAAVALLLAARRHRGRARIGHVSSARGFVPAAGPAGTGRVAGSSLAYRLGSFGWSGWLVPVGLGLGAATLAAGLSPVGAAELAVRAGAVVVGVVAAVGVAGLADRRRALADRLTVAAPVAAAAALLLAVLA